MSYIPPGIHEPLDPPQPPPPPKRRRFRSPPAGMTRRDLLALLWAVGAVVIILVAIPTTMAVHDAIDDSERVEQLETDLDELGQARLGLEADIEALDEDLSDARDRIPEARAEGFDQGYVDGQATGYYEGYDQGWRDALWPPEPYSPDINVTGVPS